MATSQYPTDVHNDIQFAGLLQVATAAADAQERNASALGKRRRDDDSMIDTELRAQPSPYMRDENTPSTLQSSASVLFREPSEKSKKYSRPPLGKVYQDLELAPEVFLRLQNAAKTFMLDDDHQERRSVVGQKKESTNNDVAKLKLWNCVEQFLDLDGNGERYFGHIAGAGIPDTPARTFFWSEDRDRIIKLCMPLFRKMVTNERQRIYASETRKQDTSKAEPNRKASLNNGGDAITKLVSTGSEEPRRHPHQTSANGEAPDSQAIDTHAEFRQQDGSNPVLVHINVVAKGADSARRLTPRISIPSERVPTLDALMAEVGKRYDISQHVNKSEADANVDGHDESRVKVWLDGGLIPVKTDGEWMVAQLSAGTIQWMDSELRVLVEV